MRVLAAFAVTVGLLFYLAGLVTGGPGLAPRSDGISMLTLVASGLKQKHAAFGVGCAQCHSADLSFAETPPTAVCLACHGSHDAVAQRTASLTPNPHHSHMGEAACTTCHSEHSESQLSCNQCHIFEMRTP